MRAPQVDIDLLNQATLVMLLIKDNAPPDNIALEGIKLRACITKYNKYYFGENCTKAMIKAKAKVVPFRPKKPK